MVVVSIQCLTVTCFWQPAVLGCSIGYACRVLEHGIWATGNTSRQSRSDVVRFALMIIPQCAIIGLSLGYAFTALLAHVTKSDTVVAASVYATPCLMAFLAADLRELLRRVQRV